MSGTEVTTEAQSEISDDLDAFSADFFGQKTVETPPASEEGTQNGAAAEQEGEVVDTEAPDTDDPDEEVVEEAPPPKKKTVQDRIDELVRQREDAKREADARIDALRKEFEDQLKALQPKQPEKKVAEPTPDDVNEDGTPKYSLGEFDPQYIRDLTRYTLEAERTQAAAQAAERAKEQEQQVAQQALATVWNQKVEAAKTEYPDFMEKGQALLNGFSNLDQGYAGYLSTVLMSMDKGPDVLYYLSNHPEEATQIVNSGAQKATLALGRIEAKFLEADAKKTLAKPKVTNAPPPPPVRARGTNGAFISVAPDTDDLEAFSNEFFKKR